MIISKYRYFLTCFDSISIFTKISIFDISLSICPSLVSRQGFQIEEKTSKSYCFVDVDKSRTTSSTNIYSSTLHTSETIENRTDFCACCYCSQFGPTDDKKGTDE